VLPEGPTSGARRRDAPSNNWLGRSRSWRVPLSAPRSPRWFACSRPNALTSLGAMRPRPAPSSTPHVRRRAGRLGRADVMVGGATFRAVIRSAPRCGGGRRARDHDGEGAFYHGAGRRRAHLHDCGSCLSEPGAARRSAVAAARDRRRIVGAEPIVAFLSYSTKGSAAGPRVERVRRRSTICAPRPDCRSTGSSRPTRRWSPRWGAQGPGSRAPVAPRARVSRS